MPVMPSPSLEKKKKKKLTKTPIRCAVHLENFRQTLLRGVNDLKGGSK